MSNTKPLRARLPRVKTIGELSALVEEIGFLPLFSNEMPGFSVMDVKPGGWWSGNDETDPWQWRMLIAAEGKMAYGKLFRQKAGFISREWYPVFANYRRDGYDYDSLYESGKSPHRHKLIMDLFTGGEVLPSYEIKRQAGFGGAHGEKGFEGAITALQMQTYLTIRGFRRKVNKKGEEYGWPVGIYCTPEELFGEEYVRSAYCEEPSVSGERIFDRVADYVDCAFDDDIKKFIK